MADDENAGLKKRIGELADRAYRPHPKASTLALPDGSPAPESLRLWASLDANYPTHLAARRSDQAIATAEGEVLAKPMSEVLRAVCLDDVAEELAGDDETLGYLDELVEEFAAELPGFGVRLEPFEHPDRVLWLEANGNATVLWYEHDAFERREPFDEWVLAIFEDDL